MTATTNTDESASKAHVPSRITDVTVYRKGAIVGRQAELPRNELRQYVLHELPATLKDGSIRLSVLDHSELAPIDVHVELAWTAEQEAALTPFEKLLEQKNEEFTALTDKRDRLQEHLRWYENIELGLVDEDNEQPTITPISTWLDALAWLRDERNKRIPELTQLDQLIAQKQREVDDAAKALSAAQNASAREATRVYKKISFSLPSSSSQALSVRLEYQVQGARWTPTYIARLQKKSSGMSLQLCAMVAQHTGETWDNVKLALSTAELTQRTALPELKSLRIGRASQPATRAPRAPLSGNDILFTEYDAWVRSTPSPRLHIELALDGSAVHQAKGGSAARKPKRSAPPREREESVRPSKHKADSYAGAPPPPPSPMPLAMPAMASMSAPMAQAPSGMAVMAKSSSLGGMVGRAGGASAEPERSKKMKESSRRAADIDMDEEMAMEPMADLADDAGYPEGAMEESREEALSDLGPNAPPSVDYADLQMRKVDSSARGKLRAVDNPLHGAAADHLAALHRHAAELDSSSSVAYAFESIPRDAWYDHRYEAESLAYIPSDGQAQTIAIAQRKTSVTLEHVIVPRVSTDAIRRARFTNPFDRPLLSGPCDVYLGDEFLVTASLATTPEGATLTLGLGVDEAIKVARNAFFEEEKGGLLKGALTLSHRVETKIASRIEAPTTVEVLEAVPYVRKEKDQPVVELGKVEPSWVELVPETGQYHWRFELRPGEERTLHHAYKIKIDTDEELVGGNRRENA